MSSCGLGTVAGGSDGVLPHSAVDLIRDTAAKCSDRLRLRVTAGTSVLDVVVATSADPHLGKSDAVQDHVELTIAAPVEAVTFGASRPDWDRSTSVVHSKPSRRLEPRNTRGLAD